MLQCYKLEACATSAFHPWRIKSHRITDRGMAVIQESRNINQRKPSAHSAPLREKKIPLLLRLRPSRSLPRTRCGAPRNDGESIRVPSEKNRGKFTNRCHRAAATSWKLMLQCYKLAACDTAVAQASLLAMRPKASKNRRLCHYAAIISWKLVLHPRSSVADKTSSHRKSGNAGDPG